MDSSFSSMHNEPLSERIAYEIINMIREHKLKPGDKLPPERELADLLNVSRPSLREALRALAIVNIVETRHGAGTYITSLKTDLLIQHLEFVFALDQTTFLSLVEARIFLESGLAGLAAERITDEEVAELRAFLDATHTNVAEDSEAFANADHKLHRMIAEAACNPIMLRFLDAVSGLANASRQRRNATPSIIQQTIEEHYAIVQAIANRDPVAARQAMYGHLNQVRQRLLLEASLSDSDTSA